MLTPSLPASAGTPPKRRAPNTSYPLQWWAASIVLGPTLLVLLGVVQGEGLRGWETWPVFLLFGLVFSLPVLGACWWAHAWLLNTLRSAFAIKLLLNAIAIGGVLLNFLLLRGSMAMLLSAVYACSIVLASLCFRLYES
ncbi:hypothetical protein GCM10011375_39060 [Hymenobacter qilianensis]|uniref:Uncharacterized protein n=2 Tax=Hymenobacter qilianensis TaxID=1385715 RepID=A0A7H0H198_9BACT|nr:hypothetical protein [Hymenobacter qilianensis]QNP54314.1 hypothetical protein H9L05_21010 [Hymenobacter qilianensis]GGF80171.1 hypothetical protein GCM10011375_39060 [Hymenobacter qilianensis]